jgi:hypothetical protein
MGDAESGPARLSFNPQLRVEFRGATVTSDAGLLLPRELDERLGLSAMILCLTDHRAAAVEQGARVGLRSMVRGRRNPRTLHPRGILAW